MRNVLADLALEYEARWRWRCAWRGRWTTRASARGRAGAAGHRGGQVLDLQAHAAACLRGDGVHRRQRRDGGQPVPAAVPRIAGQRDLGGQRQRAVPGRAARDAQVARGGRGLLRRAGPGAWRECRLDRTWRRCDDALPTATSSSSARATWSTDGAGPAGGAAGAARAGGRGRRLLRIAPGRGRAPSVRHTARASHVARSSIAPRPFRIDGARFGRRPSQLCTGASPRRARARPLRARHGARSAPAPRSAPPLPVARLPSGR
jgi:hypothetical protein